MGTDYTYLFPFEKIPQGSKIIIYGAGTMGCEYLQQMLLTNYAEVVGFVDRNFEDYNNSEVPIYSVDKLKQLSFDYIVLAFQANTYEKTIRLYLENLGISSYKIIAIFSRPKISTKFIRKRDINNIETAYAFKKGGISVAIKLSGALGDNIIRKKVIEALLRLDSDIHIDIYSPVASSLLRAFYTENDWIDNFIDDGGGLYSQNKNNYHIAITIANFIKVDGEDLETIKETHPFFYTKMKLLIQRCDEYRVDFSIPLFTYFAKALKQGKNCHSVYEYGGVFDIPDRDAHLILNQDFRLSYEKLCLGKYITLNYGNGVTGDREHQIAKQWPAERFEKLIRVLHEVYPLYEVVQLGGSGAVRLAGADRYIFGEKIELEMHILKHSLLHIDMDAGRVQLATQLGTKCAVLYGPTMEKFFGYEENINIKAGNCHECYGMCMDINRCARDMDEPECMYSITPEMVMERITEYLGKP